MSMWRTVMFAVCFNSVLGQYDVTPVNTLVRQGQTVTLSCALSDPGKTLVWTEYITNSTGGLITKNDTVLAPYVGRYYIQTRGSSYDLHVIQTDESYSGKYSCKGENDSEQQAYFVFLVVLATNLQPVLTSSLTDPVITGSSEFFSCKMKVKGEWEPTMTWQSAKLGTLPETSRSTPGRSILQITMTTAQTGDRISCTVRFVNPPWTGETFKSMANITTYSETRKTPPIRVIEPTTPTTTVTVVPPTAAASKGVSAGTTAGIVIGFLLLGVVSGIVAYVIYSVVKKKWKKSKYAKDGKNGTELTENGGKAPAEQTASPSGGQGGSMYGQSLYEDIEITPQQGEKKNTSFGQKLTSMKKSVVNKFPVFGSKGRTPSQEQFANASAPPAEMDFSNIERTSGVTTESDFSNIELQNSQSNPAYYSEA